MDTRGLRYFQAVAEFGSYSRGAEFLRISQPAVSRQIRALEEELGRPLFVRHSHGVSLTEAGRTLLERSQAILRQFDQARDEIRRGRTGVSGTVTLALPPAAGNVLAPVLVPRFSALYPDVFLKIAAGFSAYLNEWMMRGRVDLACLHDPVPAPGLVVTPLVREEVFLVGRRGVLPPGPVGMTVLAGLPLILPARPNASRRLLDRWLARRGGVLDVRMEVDEHLIIRALLREGIGFSLLTQGAFRSELPLGALEAWPLRPRAFWGLALMALPPERQNEAVAALAGMIRPVVREMVRAGEWHGGQVVE